MEKQGLFPPAAAAQTVSQSVHQVKISVIESVSAGEQRPGSLRLFCHWKLLRYKIKHLAPGHQELPVKVTEFLSYDRACDLNSPLLLFSFFLSHFLRHTSQAII